MESPTKEQLPRTNSTINLMCEMEGIEPPSASEYTNEPHLGLTAQHVEWIKSLIREREGQNGANTAKVDESHEAGNGTASQPSAGALNCTQCHRHFKSKRTLQQHTGEVHIGTTCFWPGCNVVVATESDLNQHLRNHNTFASEGIPNGHMTCNWPGCGKLCTLAESVARHLRRHTIKAQNA
ncbi:hypothetical protein F4804DRAFT_339139 [Jackrogersella minutella]|nr:hypothetical protein F4804DRAFT_339139 [Jackrogersella minutella]